MARGHALNLQIQCILLATLLLLVPLASYSQAKTITWKEEVALVNGQVVIVERSEDFRGVYAGGSGPGWLFDGERMRTTLPQRGEITWQGRLKPLALDVTPNGEVFLVAAAATAAGQKEYGLSGENYHVAFKYVATGRWQRIAIESVPRAFHVNIMVATQGLFIEKASTITFIDLAFKTKVDSDPRIVKWYRDWPRN